MAKVSFAKLGLKPNSDVVTIIHNEQEIEVRQYLPISEKTELIGRVINKSMDDNGYYNPLKITVFLTLEIMYVYTNLNYTPKMKEDELKLYDLCIGSTLFSKVNTALPSGEWDSLYAIICAIMENVYTYKNSAVGILENISQDYSALNYDAKEIQDSLANPENMQLLKDILTKLG